MKKLGVWGIVLGSVIVLYFVCFAVNFFIAQKKAAKEVEVRKNEKNAIARISEALEDFRDRIILVDNDTTGRDKIVSSVEIALEKVDKIPDLDRVRQIKKSSNEYLKSIQAYYRQRTRNGELIRKNSETLLAQVSKYGVSEDFLLSKLDFELINTKVLKVYQAAYGRRIPKPTGVLVVQTNYRTPVQTATSSTSASSNEFVIRDSDARELTEQDLFGLSSFELKIARNEIYARHGRSFVKKIYQNYFNSKSWYRADPYYNDSRLSSI